MYIGAVKPALGQDQVVSIQLVMSQILIIKYWVEVTLWTSWILLWSACLTISTAKKFCISNSAAIILAVS